MEKVLGAESEEQLAADLSQLSSWEGGSEGLSRSHDPYADSSIVADAQSTLPTGHRETKVMKMKRKVLRHRPDGRVEVSDESPNAKPPFLGHSRTNLGDIHSREKLETRRGTMEDYLHFDDDDDDDWFVEDSPRSLLGDFGSDTISVYSIPERPSMSYIAPQAERVRRTDPVTVLNKYRQAWQKFRFPGEDARQSLRWAVRKQMLQLGLPPRAQRRLVPNNYEVPMMKKRDALRFAVRWDLANHRVPQQSTSS
ncbi:PREDICTED: hydrolethalus syndrome protein 1 [Pseudopodoces humilis]|uniref:hydrolethalus syndrome protein 1 n=1 Tax=Pseudopodoces humilis TaxID=181119 RepID=UPI000395CB9E|nr:PREDICTED: hydrolethalus syndrome protein 1 [Pseudopodoces humilis]